MVAEAPGVTGEAHDAVFPATEFQLHRIGLAFGRLGAVFGLGLFFLFLLLGALDELLYLLHILGLAELGEGFVVEEHGVDVAFGAPAAVAAEAGAVALPCHGLAAESPAEGAVAVAALREVGQGAALHIDKGDVLVVHASAALIDGEDAAAVGAPFEGHVAVGVGGVGSGEKGARVLAVGIGHHDFGTAAQVRQLFAVGRRRRLEADFAFRTHALFGEAAAEGEVCVLLIIQFHLVDGPLALALGSVVETAAVLAETDSSLLLGSEGDATGIRQVGSGSVDVATHHEGYLLAVGRNCHAAGAAGEAAPDMLLFALVLLEGDVYFARFAAVFKGVEVAVPAE